MSTSDKVKPDRATREAELKLLSVAELKKVYFKLTKKSSLFMVTTDALVSAILKKEYPEYKAPSKKKRKSSMDRQKRKEKSKVDPAAREKELGSLDQAKLKKVHFRLTKKSSLTLTKNDLIRSIMEHEHPKYMEKKTRDLEEQKKRSSIKVTTIEEKKSDKVIDKSPEVREAQLKNLSIPLLRKLHFQLTKESSIKLVSKNKIIAAILKREYPDYKPNLEVKMLRSTSSSTSLAQDGKVDTLSPKKLPRTAKEREQQLQPLDMLALRKIYYKRTRTSSVFYVSKESLINAILQHEYKEYYQALEKKKKGKKKKKRNKSHKGSKLIMSPGPRKKKTTLRRSESGTSDFVKGKRTMRRYSLLKAFNKIDAQEEKELQQQYEHYKKISRDYAQSTGWDGAFSYDKFEDIGERVEAIVGTIAQDLQKKPREGMHQEYVIMTLPILTDDAPLDISWVEKMAQQFRLNRILQYENAWQILKRLYPLLRDEPNVVDAETADGEDASFNIVGDLHGQLDDLLTILQLAKFPCEQNRFLFNGDFVDRGQFSCEVVLLVFALKVACPDYVFLNRGNHEASNLNAMYGFEKEVIEKYDHDMYELFSNLFAFLPIATLINDAVFVVHGGLSWQDFTIEELQELDRFHRLVPEGLIKDLLWSDPEDIEGRQESARGAGLEFGEDVTEAFKEINNVQLVIRSHEVVEDGYHIGHCITVFSASNYCGDTGNKGAYLHIDYPFKLRVATYMASNLVEQKEESGRNVALEKSLIAKLLVRVANNRAELEKYCDGVADDNGFITKEEWSESLNQVLGIDVPFVRLAEQLGLGDFANQDVERIKYKEFLENFRPVDPMQEGCAVKTGLGELMFQKRVELMSLFRSFDTDKEGTISIDEFKKGITSLIKIGGHSIDEPEIDRIAKEIDLIDGLFFYEDYFSNYAPVDMAVMPNKRSAVDLRKSKNIILNRVQLGVMDKGGMVDPYAKEGGKVKHKTGINTLVNKEMEEQKMLVLGELRRKVSIDAEERQMSELEKARAEAVSLAERQVAEEFTTTDDDSFYSEDDGR